MDPNKIKESQEDVPVEKIQGKSDESDAKSWTSALIDSLVKSEPTEAIMPVDRDAELYNMRHEKRGKAIIFNHMNFQNGQSQRKGTDADSERLNKCLSSFGFKVEIHKDKKKADIFDIIAKLQKMDHSNRDCLLIVIMSHGEEDKIFCSDYEYKPQEIWDCFTADKCPTLAGKPKLFFVQACRGDQLDSGTLLKAKTQGRTQHDAVDSSPSPKHYIVPNYADFLIVYSTAPGHYSWRNTSEGSWFIQSLTKVLTTYKDKKDLLSMMTIVAREVALNFESNVPNSPSFDQKKQIPMINSTLIRDVYLLS